MTRARAALPWRGATWVAAPAAVLAVGAVSRAWIADDALIYVAVAERLLGGDGPTFSTLVRIESATGPLWLAVLAVAGALTPFPIDVLSVWLSAACAVAGMWLATRAAALLVGSAGEGDGTELLLVPVGLLGLAVWPPMWDFATSGLEMGAVVLWLGTGAWILVRARSARAIDAFVLGLGPLLRPDLAVVSAVLLVTLVVATGARRDIRRWVVVLASAAALPVAWQLFRMGWYASTFPAAAAAKEASTLRPAQGLRYLWRSLADGALLTAGIVGFLLWRRFPPADRSPSSSAAGDGSRAFVRWSILAAGLIHIVYVVVIGGDFMRGRLLIPGGVLVATSVGTVRLAAAAGRWVVPGIALAVVVGLIGATSTSGLWHGIVDERDVYVRLAGTDHPVSSGDYATSERMDEIEPLLDDVPPGSLVILRAGGDTPAVVPLRPEIREVTDLVVVAPTLGIIGTRLPESAVLLDPFGLADPLAGHQRLLRRGRPGHEKNLPAEWYVAWLADPEAPIPEALDADGVAAARRALGCGDLARLVDATTGPMDLGRFVDNLALAPALSGFRFHPDPLVAEVELCR